MDADTDTLAETAAAKVLSAGVVGLAVMDEIEESEETSTGADLDDAHAVTHAAATGAVHREGSAERCTTVERSVARCSVEPGPAVCLADVVAICVRGDLEVEISHATRVCNHKQSVKIDPYVTSNGRLLGNSQFSSAS